MVIVERTAWGKGGRDAELMTGKASRVTLRGDTMMLKGVNITFS